MPDPILRNSPSGVLIDASGGGAVESVFGRQGDVVAEPGDYGTDLVDNASNVPGASTSDALETLVGSDERLNASTVPGVTVSDALDYIEASIPGVVAGAFYDTFVGGASGPFTTSNLAANVGDTGWNIAQLTTSTGWTVVRLAPEAGVIGAFRLTSPTATPSGSPAGPYLYLGRLDASFDTGCVLWQSIGSVRFRVRFDPSNTAPNNFATVSLFGHSFGATQEVGFGAFIAGNTPAPNANYIAICRQNPGTSFFFDTHVPVDALFHDFEVRRVSSSHVEWYIDGVLVQSNSVADSIPPDAAPLVPCVAALAGSTPVPTGQLFVDIDTYQLVPA